MSRSPSRRLVLQLGAYSAVFVYVGGCRRAKPETPQLQFLTEAEYATVSAACERILPHDEDPGAIDLGVPDYIDHALATDMARWSDKFRAGLVALDAESQHRSGSTFGDASPTAQDNLLEDWHDGHPEQAEMVHMLVTFTFEGAFGDPSHGGNRDGRGWRLIGFEPCEPRPHVMHG